MALFARLALESDRKYMHVFGPRHVAEIRPDLHYMPEKAEANFDAYLNGGNPIIWVAESNREPVGYLEAKQNQLPYTSGFFAELRLIYVRPDKRGSRAAAELMQLFNAWCDLTKPDEVIANTANGLITPRTVAFLRKYGFESAGQVLKRRGVYHGSKR